MRPPPVSIRTHPLLPYTSVCRSEAIYTISGDDPTALVRRPHLEGFTAKGVEVLLMSDPVDDFWLSMVPDYQGKRFKSVTRGGADLDKIAGDDATAGEDAGEAEETPGIDGLVAFVRLTLKAQVQDVRVAARLHSSPVRLATER